MHLHVALVVFCFCGSAASYVMLQGRAMAASSEACALLPSLGVRYLPADHGCGVVRQICANKGSTHV